MQDIFDLSPDRLMLLALFVMMGLVALFALAILARIWGAKMSRGGGAAKGLDLVHLERQRRTGEITEEEYQAIAQHVAGKRPPAAPIKQEGPTESESDAEGSRPNGQE
jgi:hypothetical protein